MLNTFGFVALGGGIGAMLRYGVIVSAVRILGPGFPAGTMIVNVAGSFIMGIAAIILMERMQGSALIPFIMVGVLGGFTTFSSFSLDTMILIEKGQITAAASYIIGSAGLSILALFLGFFIARNLWG
ncbi:MAG: fluoride efflux transporter CrcB [Rhodobacterales bacterium]